MKKTKIKVNSLWKIITIFLLSNISNFQ